VVAVIVVKVVVVVVVVAVEDGGRGGVGRQEYSQKLSDEALDLGIVPYGTHYKDMLLTATTTTTTTTATKKSQERAVSERVISSIRR